MNAGVNDILCILVGLYCSLRTIAALQTSSVLKQSGRSLAVQNIIAELRTLTERSGLSSADRMSNQLCLRSQGQHAVGVVVTC